MRNRRVFLNLVVFTVLFVVMVSWAVRSIVSVDAIEKPYTLSAEFSNAFGVGPHAEVTYRGVPYGAVTSVARRPGGVTMRMKVKRSLQVPGGSTAKVLRKSVVGEPYIDFEPPAGYTGGPPYLPKGAVVPVSRTSVPLEFSELLRSASGLISSIPPDDVQTLLHELAVGLHGRGDALRDLTESGDQLSSTLVSKTEALDRLMTNQTRLLHVTAEHRGSLGKALTDLEQVSATLRAASTDTQVLLDRGSRFLGQTADLVSNQKQNLDCTLSILEVIVDETSTPRRLAELKALLDLGPKAFNQLLDATDVEPDGRWIRVGLIGNTTNPPKQYNPPKPLPGIPAVPGCTSALRAAASGQTVGGTAAPGTTSQTLPATGGTLAALVGLAFLAASLITRMARSQAL
ncbi:MAG TPA: MCE family protein [Acidimicrobiales bacterium]|jgi:phospholipid/cholesterol/gamma-HCH transport system substrate-binding protein|nr:MCE family protein [Acidimicrobiales bacterium]